MTNKTAATTEAPLIGHKIKDQKDNQHPVGTRLAVQPQWPVGTRANVRPDKESSGGTPGPP